jgi:NitT/TauT family transport system ATP-binding protein
MSLLTEAATSPATGVTAGDSADAAIDCRNCSVRFVTDRRVVTAFDNVSFTVGRGGFLSVLGPSGCGKSTLLRVVADLIDPSKGTMKLFGMTPRQARLQRSLGFVFQDAALLPWRSALQNVELPLEVGGARSLPKGAPTPRELLKLVGLEGWEHSFPHELSGGMRQRVSIARALLGGPRLLLMDEPFGALDEITRDRLNEELRRIWLETETTILFVTHSVYEAMFLGEQVMVMSANPGRVRDIVPIDLPRGRDSKIRETDGFVKLAAQLRDLLGRPS